MYGKITNGKLEVWDGKKIFANGRKIINPKEETLLSLGYKPIIIESAPKTKEGDILIVNYIDDGAKIRPKYEIIEVNK